MNRQMKRSVVLGSCVSILLGGFALPIAGCESKAPAPAPTVKPPADKPADKPAEKPAAPAAGDAPKESNK